MALKSCLKPPSRRLPNRRTTGNIKHVSFCSTLHTVCGELIKPPKPSIPKDMVNSTLFPFSSEGIQLQGRLEILITESSTWVVIWAELHDGTSIYITLFKNYCVTRFDT